jgi:hypothetical protein
MSVLVGPIDATMPFGAREGHTDRRRKPILVVEDDPLDREMIDSQNYALKANSCITKPGDFERLVEVARAVHEYWCEINQIPKGK